MRALVKCAKCFKMNFEGEVVYSSENKDYICRDSNECKGRMEKNNRREGKSFRKNRGFVLDASKYQTS